MTYYDAHSAPRRSYKHGRLPDSTLVRFGAAAALFAIFSVLLVLSDLPETPPIVGNDWHGNVAAFGAVR